MPRIQKLGNATNFIQPFFESSVYDTITHNSFPPTHHFIHCEERIRAVRRELSVEMLNDFKIKQLLNFFLFFPSTCSPRLYLVHGLKLHIYHGIIHFLTGIPRVLLAKHPSTSHWIKVCLTTDMGEQN